MQDKRVIGSVSEAVWDATKHRQDEDPGVPDPAAHEPRGVPRRAALGRQRAEQVGHGSRVRGSISLTGNFQEDVL